MFNNKTTHNAVPTDKPFNVKKSLLLVKAEEVSSLGVVLKVLSDEDGHVPQKAQVSLPKTF